MKVGPDLADNKRRAALMREEIGPAGASCWMPTSAGMFRRRSGRWRRSRVSTRTGSRPTSADDVLGHAAISRAVAPVGVATGEVCQNRVIFKQLLQARAMRFVQVDACRMAGVSEALVVL